MAFVTVLTLMLLSGPLAGLEKVMACPPRMFPVLELGYG